VRYDQGGWIRPPEPVNKSDYQVGDKVRTIVGTVTDIPSCYRVAVTYHDDTTANYHTDYVELVERPKKEPKLGSIWRYAKPDSAFTYVYVGDGQYYIVGSDRQFTTHSLPDDESFQEITGAQ
jgi:hypothetical protein